jgi:hypothetical protein
MLSSAEHVVRLYDRSARVEVRVRLDRSEHDRRRLVGLGAVTSERMLDVLMSLPVGVGVRADALNEADQQVVRRAAAGIVDKTDGSFVRQLVRPLVIESVRTAASSWSSAQPVVSRFAAHCERTVLLPAARLDPLIGFEAEHLGVGIETDTGEMFLAPRPFVQRRFTTVGWAFSESVYGQWLDSSN